jgi:Protein of unknown function (DUF3800)
VPTEQIDYRTARAPGIARSPVAYLQCPKLDGGDFRMYLLFADESGTHGSSHAFIVGGLAVHEHDAQNLQRSLASVVEPYAIAARLSPEDLELHAAVMRNAKPPSGSSKGKPVSPWALIQRHDRLRCLDDAYQRIARFRPSDPDLPVVLFGVVLDQNFHTGLSTVERERFAYEVLLNKFDVMLKRLRTVGNSSNRGLVIHDRRVVAERDIQEWTREWQKAAGTVGQLRNMADVPLFADSRASRLIQAADLVSYALYRHYDPGRKNRDYVGQLWNKFDTVNGSMHGCVHFTPSFGAGSCQCKPCQGRLLSEAARMPIGSLH